MKKIILSIDWDHTLRHVSGLDTQILILIIYCQGKGIPVGLTTHRDRENFILYSLYYWQYQIPQHKTDALAAAIDYWEETWFKPMGIRFDFINARYQPAYDQQNYYLTQLKPFERHLATDIHKNEFLTDKLAVKQRIADYTQKKEPNSLNNEYKQSQIVWLVKQYRRTIKDPLEIWHIDDSKDVTTNLRAAYHKHRNCINNVTIKPVSYTSFPLFSNSDAKELVKTLGLLDAARAILTCAEMPTAATKDDGLCMLATILFIIHNVLVNELTKAKLIKILENLKKDWLELSGLIRYARSQINEIFSKRNNPYLLPNRHL